VLGDKEAEECCLPYDFRSHNTHSIYHKPLQQWRHSSHDSSL